MSEAIHRIRVTLRPYRLALRRPWVTATGVLTERHGWLLALRDGAGRVGYGECAPFPEAGTESYEAADAWITRWSTAADGAHRSHLETALGATGAPPAVRCAIECALIDLRARAAGQPFARYLDPAAASRVRVNAAVGALDDGVVGRMEEAWLAGFRIFKVKVGLAPVGEELARLEHLAERLPGGLLRIDANGAWDREQSLTMVDGLNPLPVESLEEPLAEPDLPFLSLLQRRARFPIALDESLADGRRAIDRGALFAPRSVRRLILKPAVLGGVAPAWALARRARRAGMECVVTTTLDGAAGGWLATQLAALVDDGLTAHGLATGGWLAEDIGRAPAVEEGAIRLPAAEGLGYQPADGLC